MTRQQVIERWRDIAKTIFTAEENIAKEWNEKLHAAVSLSPAEQVQFVNDYCEAVATEIVSATSDEILEATYGKEEE